jgi:hypothetical protein
VLRGPPGAGVEAVVKKKTVNASACTPPPRAMHVRAPRLRLCLPLAPSPPAASSRHGTTDGSRRSTARASTATGERKSHHHLVAALPRRTWLPLLTRLVGRPTGYYSVLLLLQHPSTKLFPRTKYGVLRTTRIIQVQKGLRTAWHGWLASGSACLHGCTAALHGELLFCTAGGGGQRDPVVRRSPRIGRPGSNQPTTATCTTTRAAHGRLLASASASPSSPVGSVCERILVPRERRRRRREGPRGARRGEMTVLPFGGAHVRAPPSAALPPGRPLPLRSDRRML